MYELAKRKQGDGRIVIDKKRSFMLFSETMRDEYESIVLDESPDLLHLKFESLLSACAEGQHDEDAPDLLLKAVAFYVLDSEYQDFGRAAELMRITVELLDAPEGLCLLGLFNYLMPDQTQEDIERKAGQPEVALLLRKELQICLSQFIACHVFQNHLPPKGNISETLHSSARRGLS